MATDSSWPPYWAAQGMFYLGESNLRLLLRTLVTHPHWYNQKPIKGDNVTEIKGRFSVAKLHCRYIYSQYSSWRELYEVFQWINPYCLRISHRTGSSSRGLAGQTGCLTGDCRQQNRYIYRLGRARFPLHTRLRTSLFQKVLFLPRPGQTQRQLNKCILKMF